MSRFYIQVPMGNVLHLYLACNACSHRKAEFCIRFISSHSNSFGDSITRMDEEETSVEFVKNSSVAIERKNYLAKSKLIAIGTGRKSLLIESWTSERKKCYFKLCLTSGWRRLISSFLLSEPLWRESPKLFRYPQKFMLMQPSTLWFLFQTSHSYGEMSFLPSVTAFSCYSSLVQTFLREVLRTIENHFLILVRIVW